MASGDFAEAADQIVERSPFAPGEIVCTPRLIFVVEQRRDRAAEVLVPDRLKELPSSMTGIAGSERTIFRIVEMTSSPGP